MSRETSQLVVAVIASLDDAALDLLAQRLAPRLTDSGSRDGAARPAAYTVQTLAADLAISPRGVRAAIERGELEAAKRGGRWIIGADAVEAWARPDVPGPPRVSRSRRAAPIAADSLRAVVARLDADTAEATA